MFAQIFLHFKRSKQYCELLLCNELQQKLFYASLQDNSQSLKVSKWSQLVLIPKYTNAIQTITFYLSLCRYLKNSILRTFALMHPYCRAKFTCHIMHWAFPKQYNEQWYNEWPLVWLCLHLTSLDVPWTLFFYWRIIFSTDFLSSAKKFDCFAKCTILFSSLIICRAVSNGSWRIRNCKTTDSLIQNKLLLTTVSLFWILFDILS